jgi:hypothetical protein
MKVRFTSALVAALTACVMLPAASAAAPASQGCDESHHSDTGHGANQGGPYDSTCDGSPSGNGNGNGQATGKPCAGCVGNADDKNPKGQMPNGSDHNAGYECDRNHGIGQTNPAHTGCRQTTVNPPPPPPAKCPDGSPIPASGKCDHDNGGGNKCPDGSQPVNGSCGQNNGGNKCPDGSQPVNGSCEKKTETPTTTSSTTPPPPGQAVLGQRESGGSPGTPKAETPAANEQEVLGENAAGTSPSATTPPASAQQAQPANASNKSLPFTGTDLIAVLLAGGIALAGGLGLRRLASNRA